MTLIHNNKCCHPAPWACRYACCCDGDTGVRALRRVPAAGRSPWDALFTQETRRRPGAAALPRRTGNVTDALVKVANRGLGALGPDKKVRNALEVTLEEGERFDDPR